MISDSDFAREYSSGFGFTAGYIVRKLHSAERESGLHEEIAQSAWVRAWEKRHLYHGINGCSFRTWVCHIAFNLFQCRLRSRSFRNEITIDVPIPGSVSDSPDWIETHQVDETPSVESRLVMQGTVAVALGRITPHERRLLRMRFVDETPYATIAATLKMNEQTIKSRVHRALSRAAGMEARARKSARDRGDAARSRGRKREVRKAAAMMASAAAAAAAASA